MPGRRYRGQEERKTELREEIKRAEKEGTFLKGEKPRELGHPELKMLTDPSEEDLKYKKLDRSRMFYNTLLPQLRKTLPNEISTNSR